MFRGFVAGQRACGLIAVEARHYNVHDDQIGLPAAGFFNSLFAGFGGDDLIIAPVQDFDDYMTFSGGIVDDEDFLMDMRMLPECFRLN